MKKFSIFTAIFMIMVLVFCTTPSFAKDVGPYSRPGVVEDKPELTNTQYSGMYIGIGGSYARQNFCIDKYVSEVLNYIGADDEFSNTKGVNLKIGYHVDEVMSIEFNFDYLPGFEWDYNYGSLISADAEVNIKTFMLVIKAAPDFGSEVIRPFIVTGFGLMYNELDVSGTVEGHPVSSSISETGPCFKIGVGTDFFIEEHISVGFEIDYVVGTETLAIRGQDIVDRCKYINYTLGVAYHF